MLDTAPLAPLHKSAARDLVDGARRVELWVRLGWLDVKRRYRRTTLGPFWSVVSLAVFVVTIGTVGSGLWKLDPYVYIPYLTAGLIAWNLITTGLGEGCTVLITNSGLFRNARCDFSVLVYALVWRNLLTFIHHLLIYALVVLALAPQLLTPAILLVVPGLALLAINGIWATLLLGIACLRFRDIPQLVTSILQAAMFLTPIFWPIDRLEGTVRLLFVHLNPLYHCVEVLRAPLLGSVPTAGNYIGVIGVAAVGWSVAYWVFARFRARISYWI
jgi:ABC-type polysaccharide/polyol phosphate export permease